MSSCVVVRVVLGEVVILALPSVSFAFADARTFSHTEKLDVCRKSSVRQASVLRWCWRANAQHIRLT